MCSMNDDPTTYDKVTAPRVYKLSGDPVPRRASVALAVLGELLEEAERLAGIAPMSFALDQRVLVLREARNRVGQAEAEYADRYGTVEP